MAERPGPVCRGVLVAVLCLMGGMAAAPPVFGHGGGLDGHGCHHNRKEGGYHCHRGPLAGHAFFSAEAARLAEYLAGLLARAEGNTVPLALRDGTTVTDGDTVEIDGHRIRLQGIDAPELAQQCTVERNAYLCGERARAVLSDLIAQGDGVVCDVDGYDYYGRFLGVCRAADGADLNREMVRRGWALAYRRFSELYVPDEDRARRDAVGMWAGDFQPPWDWRRDHPR
ncbi:MAG: thermonuclease family protein [Leptospirillia bacterium]